jgi:REP element-mobilizing transposase RayT
MRAFLALLAGAVRQRLIEVHAFALMHTHFHLLVRSHGHLSEAMRRVLNAYVRRFNRERRRDGSLFRGRFRSKRVRSVAYRRVLVRYIDENPVVASMASAAHRYPWGSAIHYAKRGGPPWLARHWIESEVVMSQGGPYDPDSYFACFAPRVPGAIREWIDRGLETNKPHDDEDLDQLLAANPEQIRDWMARKTWLADGTQPGRGLVPPCLVAGVVARHAEGHPGWTARRRFGGRAALALPIAEVGLLCRLSGLSLREVSARLGVPLGTVEGRLLAHRRATDADEAYRETCDSIAVAALAEFAAALRGEV